VKTFGKFKNHFRELPVGITGMFLVDQMEKELGKVW